MILLKNDEVYNMIVYRFFSIKNVQAENAI